MRKGVETILFWDLIYLGIILILWGGALACGKDTQVLFIMLLAGVAVLVLSLLVVFYPVIEYSVKLLRCKLNSRIKK